jgi:hypothetical protein
MRYRPRLVAFASAAGTALLTLAGDTVRVVRNDGSTAVFRTTSVERVPKDEFPTERVYGDLDHVGLRLVTCGGAFDRRRGSYTANVIVYAVLTGVERDAQAPPG